MHFLASFMISSSLHSLAVFQKTAAKIAIFCLKTYNLDFFFGFIRAIGIFFCNLKPICFLYITFAKTIYNIKYHDTFSQKHIIRHFLRICSRS